MRVAVIEDNDQEREAISNHIAHFSKEYDCPLTVKAFPSAEQFFWGDEEYDIIFLDIQLPGENGISAAHRIREKNRKVILFFVTSMTQYAIQGYEVSARDYIVKPLIYPEFAHKLKKVVDSLNKQSSGMLSVKAKDGLYVFPVTDLRYLEVDNHTLSYHFVERTVERTGTLSSLNSVLREYGFLKCNQSFFVNPHYITRIQDNLVYLGEETLTISKPQRKAFLNDFQLWLMNGGR